MTIEEAKAKLVSWVNSQVGYREGQNNWNKYAPMVQQDIGWNAQNQPWCSIFVVAAFTQNFGHDVGCRMMCTTLGSASAACNGNAQCYQSAGRFYYSPEVGDQVFYNNFGHTGIVVAVSGSSITTVDGNYSDAVTKRYLSVYDSQICGYGRPKWELASDQEDTEPAEEEQPTETDPNAFSVGEWVTVNSGARDYSGMHQLNQIVFQNEWQIKYLNGDRAVLDEDRNGRYHIMTPVHTYDLTKCGASAVYKATQTVSVGTNYGTGIQASIAEKIQNGNDPVIINQSHNSTIHTYGGRRENVRERG